MEVEVRPAIEPDEGCAAQGPRALCSAAATVPVFKEDTEEPVLVMTAAAVAAEAALLVVLLKRS